MSIHRWPSVFGEIHSPFSMQRCTVFCEGEPWAQNCINDGFKEWHNRMRSSRCIRYDLYGIFWCLILLCGEAYIRPRVVHVNWEAVFFLQAANEFFVACSDSHI